MRYILTSLLVFCTASFAFAQPIQIQFPWSQNNGHRGNRCGERQPFYCGAHHQYCTHEPYRANPNVQAPPGHYYCKDHQSYCSHPQHGGYDQGGYCEVERPRRQRRRRRRNRNRNRYYNQQSNYQCAPAGNYYRNQRPGYYGY